MKLFFSVWGAGAPCQGVESIWSAIKCQKGQYVDIFTIELSDLRNVIVANAEEVFQMLLAGGLLKKNIMCIKIFIRYHHLPHLQVKKINYSAIIDFFNNVIQIIYWPGWCRHRWLAASKASPAWPGPLLSSHRCISNIISIEQAHKAQKCDFIFDLVLRRCSCFACLQLSKAIYWTTFGITDGGHLLFYNFLSYNFERTTTCLGTTVANVWEDINLMPQTTRK